MFTGGGGIRPQRERKTVRHYTDDNPNTFTVKRRKGDPPEPSPPKPTGAKRGRKPGRKKKNVSHSSAETAATTAASPTKLKSATAAAVASTSPTTTATAPETTNTPRKRKMRVVSESGNNNSPHDTILSHAVALQPIFPEAVVLTTTVAASNHNNTSSSNGTQQPPPPPTWKRLGTAYQHALLQRKGPAGQYVELPPPAVTCWTTSQSSSSSCGSSISGGRLDDWAVGDVAGGVTIYSATDNRPAVLLHTTAWKREQERPLLSKKVIQFPNMVLDVAWSGAYVVCLTATELEVFWIRRQQESSRWWLQRQVDNSATATTNEEGCWWWSEQAWKTIPLTHLPTMDVAAATATTTTSSSSALDHQQASFSVWPVEDTVGACQILWTTDGITTLQDDNNKSDDFAAATAKIDDTNSSNSNLIHIQLTVVTAADDGNNKNGSSVASPQCAWQHMQPRNVSSSTAGAAACFVCLTAIWDASFDKKKQRNRKQHQQQDICLAVALTGPDRVDLLRWNVSTGELLDEVEAWTSTGASAATGSSATAATMTTTAIAAGTTTSTTSGVSLRSECRLQQSASKQYTFLSGYKGIRMYVTETLTCLTVFGESVALHGKTVLWQSCQWVPAPSLVSKEQEDGQQQQQLRMQKKQVWWERADEVACRAQQNELQTAELAGSDSISTTNEADEFWLVGVPHPYKGPDELSSTLYVWKVGVPAPITTLHAPPGGCLGISIQPDISIGWKMTVATAETGELWEWKTSMQSNFAGVMYPVGYRVIEDNFEYIEDEDELDQAIVFEDEGGRKKSIEESGFLASDRVDMDDELARALRLSLLEQEREMKKRKEEAMEKEAVDIFGAADDEDGHIDVPCRPDLWLFRDIDGGGSPVLSPGRESSPQKNKDGFESEILSSLPQTRSARRAFQKMQTRLEAFAPTNLERDDNPNGPSSLPPRIKGKRTKQANVEALLNASVKPELRRRMEEAQAAWANGSGSRLRAHEMGAEKSNDTKAESLKPSAQLPESVPANGVKKPPQLKMLSLSSRCSDEEKELALELLLLSPGRSSTPAAETSKAPKMPFDDMAKEREEKPTIPAPVSTAAMGESIVTPSEYSPTEASPAVKANENETEVHLKNHVANVNCAACRGRMVVHACGLRETPIDYEAIERAERERKEREEAEKQRLRVEKRRAADARRREARKKKKEEEERKRREEEARRREQEESLRRLEAERFEEAHIQEHEEDSLRSHGFQPSFSPLSKGHTASAMQAQAVSHQHSLEHSFHHSNSQDSYYRGSDTSHINSANEEKHGSAGQGWNPNQRRGSLQAPSETYSITSSVSAGRNEPITIDGTEVRPSTSLSASDALAALAGLADSMPIATTCVAQPPSSTQPIREAFPPAPASWYASTASQEQGQKQHQQQQQQQEQHIQYERRLSHTNTRYQDDNQHNNHAASTVQDLRTANAEVFLENFNNNNTAAAAVANGNNEDNGGSMQTGDGSSNRAFLSSTVAGYNHHANTGSTGHPQNG